MQRLAIAGALCLAAIASHADDASADPLQVGGWFGPRVYSSDSLLGYIDDAPAHPMLENTIALGGRIAKPFFYPWLIPEFELALAPTRTTPAGGASSVSVFWLDPRAHVRFALPSRYPRIQPFVLVGGGAPIAISGARKTFNTAIVGDGYLGAGFRFDTQKNFILRFDARIAILPGADAPITPEIDVGFGIEFTVGKGSGKTGIGTVAQADPALDSDGDGIPDNVDKCPDRAEDFDGFEDQDGCPDIDNDLDKVLDIADKCPNVPETYNGFDDDDGCPDTVPPAVDALRGTIEGLLYADGETVVRDSALRSIKKIAKTMKDFPSIRVVLVGHTDSVEAKQFASPQVGTAPAPGSSPDLAALSADLSRARAEAVKQALGVQGIAPARIDVEGHGAEEPVGDNAKPRGRLANRRVEIKLFVPPSAGAR